MRDRDGEIQSDNVSLSSKVNKGEKRQKKKEAIVGVNYVVESKVREAEEIAPGPCLRSFLLSDDWPAYCRYRIGAERRRLHGEVLQIIGRAKRAA